jgi:hypothetical protein
MVVGGYALAFHGKPRHTGDLDIWIDLSDDNARKMVQVLNDFGMSSLGLNKIDFIQKGGITQIGYPPLRIDIINEIDGIDFSEAYANKLIIDIDSLPVNFIGLSDFIKTNMQVAAIETLRMSVHPIN